MDEVQRKLNEAIDAAARHATGPEPAELRRRLRRRRRRGTAVTLALLLGAGIAVPNVVGGREPSRVASRPSPDKQLTCDDMTFPESAMSAPPGAEKGRDPAAHALVAFLASDAARDPWVLPKRGWKQLARDPDRAMFALGKPGKVDFVVRVRRQGGTWKWVGYGGCRPRVVVDGLVATSWSLHTKALEPGTRKVPLAFVTGECVRFDRAVVSTTPDAVTITVLLRRVPPPAGNACADVGYPGRQEVVLPEPLGRRALVDGGTVPARVVWPK
jgi:hypothetical protein